MKTLIAVPCMQTVPTRFMRCLIAMRRLPETYTMIIESTLVHDARNEFASRAITGGFDRVLWIDSDMVFDPDLLERLSRRLDEGKLMVSGLCFKRVFPTEPVIYKAFEERVDPIQGEYIQPVIYTDYPRLGDDGLEGGLIRVAGSGFGATMTDVGLLRRVWDKYGPPFSYYKNLGEDMSFCYRVGQMGESIWCDPEVHVGHIGQMVFTEETYRGQGVV